MAAQKKTVGFNRGNAGGFSENPPDERPTLTQAGIDKNLDAFLDFASAQRYACLRRWGAK
jgi:hypothetical protein